MVTYRVLIRPIHEFLQLHASQIKLKTHHPAHPRHKHTYFNNTRVKNHLQQRLLHNTHSHRHPPSHYNIHTNKHASYAHTNCLWASTRGNIKILRTPLPHISSSEETLPRITRRAFAQLRTHKSPFFKSYLNKVDAKSQPSPLYPLCNTHTRIISSTAPTYAPRCHPWICGHTPME